MAHPAGTVPGVSTPWPLYVCASSIDVPAGAESGGPAELTHAVHEAKGMLAESPVKANADRVAEAMQQAGVLVGVAELRTTRDYRRQGMWGVVELGRAVCHCTTAEDARLVAYALNARAESVRPTGAE